MCIPMFALSEAIHTIKEKRKEDGLEVVRELYRLIDKGELKVRYFTRDTALGAFDLAKELISIDGDERDYVSPMDALILATAASDPECSVLYTTDKTLLINAEIYNTIRTWRNDRGYESFRISDISEIIKLK